MAADKKKDEFTVQGVDPPVPVQGLSGRAGSPGPSSNDRSALPVATQAGSGYRATGVKTTRDQGLSSDRADPKFRGRINSLPENKTGPWICQVSGETGKKRKDRDSLLDGDTAGINLSYTSLVWDDEEKRSVKKPKETGTAVRGRRLSLTGGDKMKDNILFLIQGVDKELRNIRKFVDENKNTKVEIKRGVEKLTSIVSQLTTREVLEVVEGMEERRQAILLNDSEDKDTQTKRDIEERATQTEEITETKGITTTETKTTQTEGNAWQKGNQRLVEDFRRRIAENRGFEGYERLSMLEWPSEAYTAVREITGNPIWEGNEKDLGFFIEKGNQMEKGIARQIKRRFPETEEMQRKVEGCVALVYESKIETANSEEDARGRTSLTRIFMENDNLEQYMNILAWKEKIKEWGINRVAVPVAETGWKKVKNMLEHVFYGGSIKVMAYSPKEVSEDLKTRSKMKSKRTEGRGSDPVGKPGQMKPKRNTDALIVTVPGKSYVDTLAEVKRKVNIEEMGVKVKGVRSTRKGELLVAVEKGGDLEALGREIKTHLGMEGMVIREGGRVATSIIHIKGMDGDTTTQQLEETITKLTGAHVDAIKVKELRPAYSNTQNATVVVPKEVGEKLIKTREIRVGWSLCRVQERVNVRKCLKCWGFGHLAANCKGEDRGKLCLKCGKEGHKVRECQENSYCPICRREGHRADSTGCPAFREALATTRENRRRLLVPDNRRVTIYRGEIRRRPTQAAKKKSSKMIRLLQANLERKRAAHDLAHAVALREEIDLLIASEPNKKMVQGNNGWLTDENLDVAVLFYNKSLQVDKVVRKRGFLRIKLAAGINIICCYISPNIPIRDFKAKFEEVIEEGARLKEEYIIMGDINAKAPEWGSPVMYARGSFVAEWLAAEELVAHNDGLAPTCVTHNGSSFVDVTISTPALAKNVKGWKVLEDPTLSAHKYIQFGILGVGKPKNTAAGKKRISVDDKKLKVNMQRSLRSEHSVAPSKSPNTLMDRIRKGQEMSINGPEKTRRAFPYWWNTRISECRQACIAARRALQRAVRGGGSPNNTRAALKQNWREAKRTLAKEIRAAKRESWRELCAKLEDDIWGQGYRIATKHLCGTQMSYAITWERKHAIIRELFPQRQDAWEREPTVDPPLFTEENLRKVTGKIKTGTAPGPDNILPESVKAAAETCPKEILAVLNDLLIRQDFPKIWKEGRVILIPKGNKPQDENTKFRPICLLNTLGKLYEALIRDRLSQFLEENGALSESQFGFRRGRSTIVAVERVLEARNKEEKWCVLITLDVQNAFNSASWGFIMDKLKARNVPTYIINVVSHYLEDRCIIVDRTKIDMTAGVPQGSVLGPTLWNILYDDVLRLDLPQGVDTVGYADDLADIVRADQVPQLNARIQATLETITSWMGEHDLALSPSKSEAVVLKGPRKRDDIRIILQGENIALKKYVKYLGVTIDTHGYFGPHIVDTVKKADRRIAALTKILPNIGGPGNSKRRMLWGVVASTVLYAAPVWHQGLRVARYREMLERTQRKILLRIASAYRTVSTKALQVITAIPPIDLLVEERGRIHRAPADSRNSAEHRNTTMRSWQDRWANTIEVAQWTKTLIPDVVRWAKVSHRRTDYYITQFLTGHGSFRTYTKRIGKQEVDKCIYCEATDDPEHTVLYCPRWSDIRRQAWGELVAVLTPQNIIQVMSSNPDTWRKVADGIRQIMRTKEIEERAYQVANPPTPRL